MYLPDLILPRSCPVCGRTLLKREHHICLYCLADLPYSYFWSFSENAARGSLESKIPVDRVAALLIYREDSPSSKIVHAFKYHNRTGLGRFMADMLGKKMAESGWVKSYDYIIPVPLHPLKRWMRGYNQAEIISEALSSRLGIPVLRGALVRRKYTSTQTRKSAAERLAAMEGIFGFKKGKFPHGKSLLLVDDVMTTGATLTACANAILRSERCRIGVVTLAFAE